MEMIFLFVLGYFIGSLRNIEKVSLKSPDRILRWDHNTLAWRPVLPGTKINENETLLFAFEVKKTYEKG